MTWGDSQSPSTYANVANTMPTQHLPPCVLRVRTVGVSSHCVSTLGGKQKSESAKHPSPQTPNKHFISLGAARPLRIWVVLFPAPERSLPCGISTNTQLNFSRKRSFHPKLILALFLSTAPQHRNAASLSGSIPPFSSKWPSRLSPVAPQWLVLHPNKTSC